MVICYTIKELNAIGEMVLLKECISGQQAAVTNTNKNLQQEFLQFQQQFQQLQRGEQLHMNGDYQQSYEPLASSVADFFRKAQQNFYAQTNIDPTKVRRLSEVEAELTGRRESC